MSQAIDIDRIHQALTAELQDRHPDGEGRFELFLDSRDVKRALLGMWHYVDFARTPPVITLSGFEHPDALIHALLSAGILGPFRLLPPHEAELARMLEKDGGIYEKASHCDDKVERRLRAEFLDALQLSQWNSGGNSAVQNGQRAEEDDGLVRQAAGSAVKSFKACECIRYGWVERLTRLRNEEKFLIAPLDLSYTDLVSSQVFESVLRHFRTERTHFAGGGAVSLNNFADALSLVMMVELVRRYRSRESQVLPRFFDATRWFRDIARLANITDSLDITVGGVRASVLVDQDYLRFKATFRLGASKLDCDIKELHDRLSEIVGEENRDARLRALHQIEVGGRTLAALLQDIVDCTFLDNVWLAEMKDRQLKKLALELNAITKDVTSEKFRKKVRKVVEATTQILNRDTNEYRHLSTVWIELDKCIRKLRRWRQPMMLADREFHAIRDLGLIRFNFSSSAQDAIQNVMQSLIFNCDSDDAVTESDEWRTLVHASFHAQQDAQNAEIAGGALWAGSDYASVIRFLEPIEVEGNRIPLDVLFAAACFQVGNAVKQGEKTLGELAQRYTVLKDQSKEDGNEPLASVASSLGYLCFHLWKAKGGDAMWRRVRAAAGQVSSQRALDDLGQVRIGYLLQQAIGYVDDAMKVYDRLVTANSGLGPAENMRYAYVVNQRVYYLVEQGHIERQPDLADSVLKLANFEHAMFYVWQFTFYDTLARYYHLCATRCREERDWATLLDEAISLSEKAVALAPSDVEKRFVDGYRRLLVSDRSLGFAAA